MRRHGHAYQIHIVVRQLYELVQLHGIVHFDCFKLEIV
jgi:hypothetical protein